MRVNAAGNVFQVGHVGTHLEGVTTWPNKPAVYGPLAGRILAGAEDLIFDPGTHQNSYGTHGRIYAFDPSSFNNYFTIGAGTGPTCVGPFTAANLATQPG